jgi:AcrR family transcriptional regulator
VSTATISAVEGGAGTTRAATTPAGTGERTEMLRRLQAVPRPVPVLSRERERLLTARQREIIDRLGELFDAGFVDLTMAEIAAWANCSLRTLYSVAQSRDELVLVMVDRHLWHIGRSAREAIEAGMGPLDAVRAYLRGATVAVGRITAAFSRDLAQVPAAERLRQSHNEYLVAVTRCLLDLAVEQGEIADVDTGALARVMATLGSDLSRPEVIATLRSSPKDAADAVVDLVLRGLTAPDAGRAAPTSTKER